MPLGLFMPNCSYGYSISTYKPCPGDWTYESNLLIARRRGCGLRLPVSGRLRWRRATTGWQQEAGSRNVERTLRRRDGRFLDGDAGLPSKHVPFRARDIAFAARVGREVVVRDVHCDYR